MLHAFFRSEMLMGEEGLAKLKGSTVAIFGIGGVEATRRQTPGLMVFVTATSGLIIAAEVVKNLIGYH